MPAKVNLFLVLFSFNQIAHTHRCRSL